MARDPPSQPTTQELLDDVFWTHIRDNGSPELMAAKQAKTAHAAAEGIIVASLPKMVILHGANPTNSRHAGREDAIGYSGGRGQALL